jgi:hypothetical protein
MDTGEIIWGVVITIYCLLNSVTTIWLSRRINKLEWLIHRIDRLEEKLEKGYHDNAK